MSRAISIVLSQVHDGEIELEKEFHIVADRHRADHEVHHVAVDLARWSLQNRQALAPLADRYADDLADYQAPQAPNHPITAVREKTAELVGRRPEPGLLLLRDLRHLFLLSSGNSVLWTMLGQAAQTNKDEELLEIVTFCHSRTMRQTLWCNGMIKALSPQALTAL